MVQESLTLTEWQKVENGSDETLRNIEIRGCFLAGSRAKGILGRKVASDCAADVAGVVQGLGPCIAQQGVQVVAQTRSPLGSEAIVIPAGGGHHILNTRSTPLRIGQALHHR